MHIKRRDLFITLSLLIALGITASLIKWQAESAQQHQQEDALAAQRSALKERIEKGLYVAEPGERADGEASTLLMMEEYWGTRIGYPTGNFDFKWLQAAAKQDQAVPVAVPAGRVTYSPNNDAPVVLDPNRWTSIGPRPQNSNTCAAPCFVFNTVAGRVNDIVIDPTMPNVAYIAPDGGAVWRTTNCCSPATTWMTTTNDSPLINGTAIGDLSVDRNNGYVYAGTGDLRFGSFSFGSAGLLKSTDRGLTWQVKGEDVFGPYYPQGTGQFPQYNSIGKVEPDPANPNTLIVGAKPGVYMSYNGGDNWVGPCLPDPYPQQRQDITALVVHTNTTGLSTMFVAVGGRGISTTVQSNLGDNGANGIYKASVPTSGGCPANWQLVTRPDNGWPEYTGSGQPRRIVDGNRVGNPVGRIDLAMSPSNPNYIYAQVQAVDPQASCAGAAGCQLGIWRTTNGGVTWQQMSNGDTLNEYGDECGPLCLAIPDLCGDYPQNWYDQNIIVHPTQPDTIFFQNHNLWRSTDGGATMQDLTCGYGYLDTPPPPGVHVDNHAMAFVPGDATGNSLMAGTDGGAYISLNAMSPQPVFANLNNTLSTIEFYSGDITQNFATNPNPAAVAGAQDNGSSIWTGDPTIGPYVWNQRLGGDGMYARFDPVTEGVYMESQNGNLNFLGPRASGQPVAVRGGWASDTLSFVFPYEIYKGVPAGTPGGGEDDCLPAGCKHMIAGSNRYGRR
jgi:hypothetical protein